MKNSGFILILLFAAISVCAQSKYIAYPIESNSQELQGNMASGYMKSMLNNDLRILEVQIGSSGIIDSVNRGFGFYSSIPLNQITPMSFKGVIQNIGDDAQTDIDFNSTILDANMSVVHNQSKYVDTIMSDSLPLLKIPNDFNGVYPGEYTISLSVNQAETDQNPVNNIYPEINFEINADTVFARDYLIDSYVGNHFYTGGADGDYIGVKYFVTSPDTVKSLSVYIANQTDPGTMILGKLYKRTIYNDYLNQCETEEFTILPSHIGTWVTIPFVPVGFNDDVLEKNIEYLVGLESYGSGNIVAFGCDTEGPHDFEYATAFMLGSSWYWTTELAAIRMNVSGTVVKPFITSIPEYEVYDQTAYNYQVTTYDPQGSAVSLTATTIHPEINMTATDNGSGVMNIYIPPISSTLFTEEYFFISIEVNNGVASNIQEFWVHVTDIIEVEEVIEPEIRMYPNPVRDYLYCTNSDNSKIHVYSVSGQLVFSNNNCEKNYRIDMRAFDSGVYFIKISDNKHTITKKISHLK